MKEDPFISFIIPVYNRGNYLEACIRSILDLKAVSYEIILVDDASTDISADICEAYAGKYDFIRLIRFSENCGVGAAKQAGMEHAMGEYLYFLDSDDMIEQDSFLYTVKTLQEFPETELCMVDYYEQTGTSGRKNAIREIHCIQIMEVEDFLGSASQRNGVGFMWRYFFRRSFINKRGIRIAPIRYAEDFIFVAQCLLAADNILLCPSCCCIYQKHTAENSITRNIQFDMELMGFYSVLTYIGAFLSENHISKTKIFHVEYQVLCIAFPALLYGAFEYEEVEFEKKMPEGIFSYYIQNGGEKTILLLRYYAKSVFQELSRGKEIVLCPAGYASVKLASFTLKESMPVIGFLDNYKKDADISVKGKKIPVIHFENFSQMDFGSICVFVNSIYEKELVLQMKKIADSKLIIFSYHDLLREIQRQAHIN